MNSILFSIGNIEIRWYSVTMLLAITIGLSLFIKEGKRFNIPKDFTFNLAFWVVIFAIIGARLYYCIFNFELYKDNLIDILKIWEGGLAIHGGIIAGFITLVVYTKRYNLNPIKFTDMAVPSIIIGQAIGRWGNFFNQEAHGANVPYHTLKELHIPNFIIDGMKIDGLYYHPTFFYESIFCFIGFIIFLIIRRNKYIKRGQLTCSYLMYYGVLRFFIEYLRTDALMFGSFKVAQLISAILFIIGIVGTILLNRKGKFEDLYNEGQSGPIRF